MVRSGVQRWWVLAGVLALALVVVWWVRRDDTTPASVHIPAAPAGRPVTWDGLTVAGDRLTLGASGNPCQEATGTVVDETDDRVVVTAYAERAGGVCAQMLGYVTIDVRLERPLGARPVYDGACLDVAASSGRDESACRRVAETTAD